MRLGSETEQQLRGRRRRAAGAEVVRQESRTQQRGQLRAAASIHATCAPRRTWPVSFPPDGHSRPRASVGLVENFGPALLDQAVLDALCRALGLSFFMKSIRRTSPADLVCPASAHEPILQASTPASQGSRRATRWASPTRSRRSTTGTRSATASRNAGGSHRRAMVSAGSSSSWGAPKGRCRAPERDCRRARPDCGAVSRLAGRERAVPGCRRRAGFGVPSRLVEAEPATSVVFIEQPIKRQRAGGLRRGRARVNRRAGTSR